MNASQRIPLPLQRIEFEKVWGARNLERVPGIRLQETGPVGETWELVDRDDHNSGFLSGPFEGRNLRGLMLSERDDLLGHARATAKDQFPVLVKYLDAGKALSVQVHPTPAAAERLNSETKTEAWYILDAKPGALIYLGLRPGTTAQEFADAANTPAIADLLQPWEAKPGQLYFVPAGTVHAIGAGVTLVEVQENSDTTYRVYDWGRKGLDGKPRELHIEQALHSIDYDAVATGPVEPELRAYIDGCRMADLVNCDAFGMALLDVDSEVELETGGVAQSMHVLKGTGRLRLDDMDHVTELSTGSSWLLPAAMPPFVLDAADEGLQVIRTRTRT